jgi:hypothetical protein
MGWPWLHALMMTKNSLGVPLPGTGAFRDDLTAFFPHVAGMEFKSATGLCLVKHSQIISPSSALSLSCDFLSAAFVLVLDPH